MRESCDFLVIGSGIAGLSVALELAPHGKVVVLTKRSRQDSASSWAQGGIAAVLDPEDSFEAHVADTLTTGGGLSRRDIVEMVVEDGPRRVRRLVELGAEFSKNGRGDGLDLTREGGHSARRVVHAGDMTGQEIQRVLIAAAQEHPNVQIVEDAMVIDLIEASRLGERRGVVGAYVLHETTGQVWVYRSRATILASGGAGKVYVYTTNPDVATGDGVAMAYRAGARIANMEFFQFHPTCLYHPAAKSFLVSEALRGEGGVLRLPNGRDFMRDHHPMGSLAPRDVVARAIDYEMKRAGLEHVVLDMSARDPGFLVERFPNIHQACLRFGIDMTREPIPVVPAAHYMCGGVAVDANGRTSVPGLWAIGEVSCTGLHGANRLASNSLLEGLVYAHRAVRSVLAKKLETGLVRVPDWDVGEAVVSDEEVVVAQNWDELRRAMWSYVGIVRSDKRLVRAARRVAMLKEEIREYYWRHLVTRDLLELRNIADVAALIVASALARRESRGLHYNIDRPETDERWRGDTEIGWGIPARLAAKSG